MECASAEGDLQEVMALLKQWSTATAKGATDGDSSQRETDENLKNALQTPLVEAAKNGHAALVSFLLDQGAGIMDNVLSGAKESKSTSIYQALLDHGWDINAKWWMGITSLGSVVTDENLVKWHLEHGADPNIPSRRGFTPLDSAGYNGSFNTIKYLISHGANLQDTMALISAAASERTNSDTFEIMTFLLDHGVDIDCVERVYEPLAATVYYGTALHRAVEREDAERVRFLLQRGANRHIKGFEGVSALEVAEMRELKEMADILRNE
ncbi:hypothetical protein W97_05831 [Coniosporium apollinis CBS 100218]|uniref:Uncharacterized protein n=1 Tax=Coniosporium apollinis (strain CBS 100218) TaxID=1168221 RepID=R7YXF2_CONA1|nr:uncharacterized protein W97_05831 [Coniosporium apollinis CBS 100218]EON66585.1 hypothetical protein W97_05831 [Coniosporium apollinis CBS 100218]